MKKVMVFGVFDLLHPGHINFLKQARRLGNRLVVSVARDNNVKKIKGRLPVFNEKKRVKTLKNLKVANKVVLGGSKDPWPHIKNERPDIIALGFDQKPYVAMAELKKIAKVVRLRPFKPKVFKSTIIRKRHAKAL